MARAIQVERGMVLRDEETGDYVLQPGEIVTQRGTRMVLSKESVAVDMASIDPYGKAVIVEKEKTSGTAYLGHRVGNRFETDRSITTGAEAVLQRMYKPGQSTLFVEGSIAGRYVVTIVSLVEE
jgi:hypothetical protein